MTLSREQVCKRPRRRPYKVSAGPGDLNNERSSVRPHRLRNLMASCAPQPPSSRYLQHPRPCTIVGVRSMFDIERLWREEYRGDKGHLLIALRGPLIAL